MDILIITIQPYISLPLLNASFYSSCNKIELMFEINVL